MVANNQSKRDTEETPGFTFNEMRFRSRDEVRILTENAQNEIQRLEASKEGQKPGKIRSIDNKIKKLRTKEDGLNDLEDELFFLTDPMTRLEQKNALALNETRGFLQEKRTLEQICLDENSSLMEEIKVEIQALREDMIDAKPSKQKKLQKKIDSLENDLAGMQDQQRLFISKQIPVLALEKSIDILPADLEIIACLKGKLKERVKKQIKELEDKKTELKNFQIRKNNFIEGFNTPENTGLFQKVSDQFNNLPQRLEKNLEAQVALEQKRSQLELDLNKIMILQEFVRGKRIVDRIINEAITGQSQPIENSGVSDFFNYSDYHASPNYPSRSLVFQEQRKANKPWNIWKRKGKIFRDPGNVGFIQAIGVIGGLALSGIGTFLQHDLQSEQQNLQEKMAKRQIQISEMIAASQQRLIEVQIAGVESQNAIDLEVSRANSEVALLEAEVAKIRQEMSLTIEAEELIILQEKQQSGELKKELGIKIESKEKQEKQGISTTSKVLLGAGAIALTFAVVAKTTRGKKNATSKW